MNAAAIPRCGAVRGTEKVAARLGEDETPFVADVAGTRLAGHGESSDGRCVRGCPAAAPRVDDKSYLAYALNAAALCIFRRAHRSGPHFRRRGSGDRLDHAQKDEIIISRAMLAPARPSGLRQDLDSAEAASSDWNVLSASARSALLRPAEPARSFQRTIPTPGAYLQRRIVREVSNAQYHRREELRSAAYTG